MSSNTIIALIQSQILRAGSDTLKAESQERVSAKETVAYPTNTPTTNRLNPQN